MEEEEEEEKKIVAFSVLNKRKGGRIATIVQAFFN